MGIASPLVNEIQEWMVGLYNNERQVAIDTQNGRISPQEGGHELVSAHICKHPKESNVLVATFRFGKVLTAKPFRFRYYKFENDPSKKYSCIMRLYRPKDNFSSKISENNHTSPMLADFEELTGCEVGWTKETPLFNSPRYDGVLVNGECSLPSQSDPNIIITVRDELTLRRNELLINDRVYDPSGQLIIGNILNVPYKFVKQLK